MRARNVFLSLPAAMLAFSLSSASAFATPAEVMILRHAEKPADDSIPHLSPQGYERADQLPNLFAHDRRFEGPIAAIYAASPRKAGKSERAEETVTPLSQDLNMPILDASEFDGMEGLAEHILADPSLDGKRVVVCLVHDTIPDFAHALGAEDAPDKWNKRAFDRVWDIHFNGSQVRFDDLPQRLMPGDDDR